MTIPPSIHSAGLWSAQGCDDGQLFYDMTEMANRLTRFAESRLNPTRNMPQRQQCNLSVQCRISRIYIGTGPFRPVTGDFMFVNRRAERCLDDET